MEHDRKPERPDWLTQGFRDAFDSLTPEQQREMIESARKFKAAREDLEKSQRDQAPAADQETP